VLRVGGHLVIKLLESEDAKGWFILFLQPKLMPVNLFAYV
jgi:hypothetical protein